MTDPTNSENKGQRPKAAATKPQSLQTIMGWRIAPPRLVLGGYLAALKYIALPLLAGLALLDVALYFFFDQVLDSCYGLLCLL